MFEDEVFTDFLDSLSYCDTTVQHMSWEVKNYLNWCTQQSKDYKDEQVYKKYLEQLGDGLKASTLSKKVWALETFWCYINGEVRPRKISTDKSNKEKDYLTDYDIQMLGNGFKRRYERTSKLGETQNGLLRQVCLILLGYTFGYSWEDIVKFRADTVTTTDTGKVIISVNDVERSAYNEDLAYFLNLYKRSRVEEDGMRANLFRAKKGNGRVRVRYQDANVNIDATYSSACGSYIHNIVTRGDCSLKEMIRKAGVSNASQLQQYI